MLSPDRAHREGDGGRYQGERISVDGYSAGLDQTEERPLCAGTRRFEGVPPLRLEQVRVASLVTPVTDRVLSPAGGRVLHATTAGRHPRPGRDQFGGSARSR